MQNYLLVAILLIAASYFYLRSAVKFKIIDKPNQRSSHSKITVRGGGIIFMIAILLYFLLHDFEYPYFCVGILMISFVSFLDDIYTLSSKVRFPFQILAIVLILLQTAVFAEPIYMIALAIFLGVFIINIFNFMDGINGITGLYSIAVILGLYAINYQEHIIDEDLMLYVLISLVVFGFYNFRKKALFFAGDIGSIVIGLFIFFIGIVFTIQLKTPLMLGLMIVYGADAGCTLFFRLFLTKESILLPHRHHLYQKLVDVKKMSHLKVAFMYAFLQLFVNFIVFKTYTLSINTQFLVFFGLIFIFIFAYIYLFRSIKKTD